MIDRRKAVPLFNLRGEEGFVLNKLNEISMINFGKFRKFQKISEN
jgi:hypothetical protein